MQDAQSSMLDETRLIISSLSIEHLPLAIVLFRFQFACDSASLSGVDDRQWQGFDKWSHKSKQSL
jgi:hypothetical protein